MAKTDSSDGMPGARRFWVDFADGSVLAYYVIARLTEYSAQYQADVVNNKMDDLLQALDYVTTMDEVIAEFVPASQSERGMWKGRYVLFEPGGAKQYVLELSEETAEIRIGDTVIEAEEADCFSAGVLRLGDETYAFELRLDFPPPVTKPGSTEIDLVAANTCGQPWCRGTVRITEGGTQRTVPLAGKRGCFTYAGAQRKEDGDPPDTWAGTYRILLTDDWTWSDEQVRLSVQNGALVVKFGSVRCTDVRYVNNRMFCGIDADRQLAVQFERLADGKTQFAGAFLKGDIKVPLTGFRLNALADSDKRGV